MGGVRRHGCWVFCGSRFARVMGLPRGHGVVSGTCCSSLAQLERLKGVGPVRSELWKHYEAVYGTVERPGLLKVSRKAWANAGGSGTIFFDASTDEGGTVALAGKHGTELVHKLPDGVEQRWRVLEWDFDPFTPRSSKGKVADDSDSSDDSASEEPSKTKKRRRKARLRWLTVTRVTLQVMTLPTGTGAERKTRRAVQKKRKTKIGVSHQTTMIRG